jgi:hypothetical protein
MIADEPVRNPPQVGLAEQRLGIVTEARDVKIGLIAALEIRPAKPRGRRVSCCPLLSPASNEEDVIPLTYRRIVDVLGNRGFRLQVVFVDDGSHDTTPDITEEIAKSDPRVKTVLLSRNFGHQAAVSAGLAESDSDAVVIMDADLQDPPETVIQMIEKWLQGADIVWHPHQTQGVATQARRLQPVLSSLSTAGEYRCPGRRRRFFTDRPQGIRRHQRAAGKNRFFRGLRAWSGFCQTGVAYERQPRAAGSSKYPLTKLIGVAKDGIFNFSVRGAPVRPNIETI